MKTKKKVESVLGQWCLHNEPEQLFNGVVTIHDDEHIYFQIDGFVSKNPRNSIQTFVGKTNHNQTFTLFNCQLIDARLIPTKSSNYKVSLCLEGNLELKDGVPLLNSFLVRFDDKNKFGQASFYKTLLNENHLINFETQKDEETKIDVENGIELVIQPLSPFPNDLFTAQETITITQYCVYQFNFVSKTLINDITHKFVLHLEHFICIGLSDTVSIQASGYYDREGDFYNVIGQIYRSKPISDKHHHEFYFTRKSVESRLPELLKGWFSKKEHLTHAINSYFGPKYMDMYLETIFLSYARALEVFHRVEFSNSKAMNNDEAKRIRKLVKESSFKDSDKKIIKEKLNYLTEPTFKQRLEELINPFSTFITNFIEMDSFSKNVGDYRNWLTHYSKTTKPKVLKLEPMKMVRQMELLLDCCMLKTIGFSENEIQYMINRRPDSKIFKEITTQEHTS